jgi:hypothetical protein
MDFWNLELWALVLNVHEDSNALFNIILSQDVLHVKKSNMNLQQKFTKKLTNK